ncbi:MAG: hypothetical protein WCS70_10165 [Verrucomicrobiota bacterium]
MKIIWGVLLFAALITVVQLSEPALDSPAAVYQRLPDANLRGMAQAKNAGGEPESALLLLDYIIENNLPDQTDAKLARQTIITQLTAGNSPISRLKATGCAATLSGGNSFESLAGSTVADAVLYGSIADQARAGAFDAPPDDFITALNNVRSMTTVFPPADGAITLAKAASRAGAFNQSLSKQLRQMLSLMQTDPKSALAVEKFKDNVMPLFELAKRCRTWGEFATILLQADSPDQLKVLTKMATTTPASAKRLAGVLTIADIDSKPATAAAIDYVMRLGPKGLDALSGAVRKGTAGLKFTIAHPGFVPSAGPADLTAWQAKYQALRYEYGAGIAAAKYLLIAVLCALFVLAVVPGRYLEKLIARPGGPVAAPGAIHYFMSALLVGAVLSVLVYLLSLAARPMLETPPVAVAGETGVVVAGEHSDNAFLSGTVVLLSLAIHSVVWFFVRGKIRGIEDDETATAELRLRRLENLDVFLDLPLFTGLALTVVAFILITLNAGMSRHFAYTSTVVGILSAVSLRIRYLYPLKERLIQPK